MKEPTVCVCRHCGEPFERPHGRGPAPLYCKESHRVLAYQLRRDRRIIADETADDDDR